jgi:hypothetical protein
MEWISVKEDKPNIGFEVIVNDKYGCVTHAYYVIGKDGCYVFLDSNEDEINNVTHWQPLPIGIIEEKL